MSDSRQSTTPSRRWLTISAIGLAVLLTVTGWLQIMIYKSVEEEKVAVWFPFLLLLKLPDEIFRVLLTLIQFPLFAAAFAWSIRRWRVAPVLAVVLLSYGLCVCLAFAILRSQ